MPSSRGSRSSVDTPHPVPPVPGSDADPQLDISWLPHVEEGTGGLFLVDTSNAPSLRNIQWLAEIAVEPPEGKEHCMALPDVCVHAMVGQLCDLSVESGRAASLAKLL